MMILLWTVVYTCTHIAINSAVFHFISKNYVIMFSVYVPVPDQSYHYKSSTEALLLFKIFLLLVNELKFASHKISMEAFNFL